MLELLLHVSCTCRCPQCYFVLSQFVVNVFCLSFLNKAHFGKNGLSNIFFLHLAKESLDPFLVASQDYWKTNTIPTINHVKLSIFICSFSSKEAESESPLSSLLPFQFSRKQRPNISLPRARIQRKQRLCFFFFPSDLNYGVDSWIRNGKRCG